MSQIEQLPTTDSQHVPKRHAKEWLKRIDQGSNNDIQETIVPKPPDFTGSKYPSEISDVRITGSPEFIEAVGSLFKPFLEFENDDTRLEINLQETEDRDTGEFTGNYALYLSVAQRG